MKLKPDQEQLAFQLMKGLPIFSGVPEEALREMVSQVDAREIVAGKVVLMDQEIGRTLYVIATGRVGVWKGVGAHRRKLAVLKAPDFCGERSMFEESPASALVKTEEDSLIYSIDRNAFLPISVKYPAMMDPIKRNMEVIRAQRMGPSQAPASGDALV